MKRILSLLLAVIICISLIACGASKDDNIQDDKNTPVDQETETPTDAETETPTDAETEAPTEAETEEFDGPSVYEYLYYYIEELTNDYYDWDSTEACANDLYEQVVKYYKDYHNVDILSNVRNYTEKGRNDNFFDLPGFKDVINEGEECYGFDGDYLGYVGDLKLYVFYHAHYGTLEDEIIEKYDGILEWDHPVWYFPDCDYLFFFIAE